MSFRLKTIFGIAFIEGVLFLSLVIFGTNFLYKNQDAELHKRAQTTARVFAATAKDAVISSDLATLDSIVSEVLHNAEIAYMRVKDVNGVLLAEGGNKHTLAKPFVADHTIENTEEDGIFDVTAIISVSGTKYGRIELGIAAEEMHDALHTFRNNAAAIVFLGMVLVAIFSFVLGTYLTRQLKALELGTQRISEGDFGFQLEVKSNDELGRTAQSFNLMSHRVKSLYEDIKENNEILDVIGRIQSRYIAKDDPCSLFKELLDKILHFTTSEFGFIAELSEDASKQPSLKCLAISNAYADINADKNGEHTIAQFDLDNIFAQIVQTRTVSITDNLFESDCTTLPRGLPLLARYLTVPITYGDCCLGLLCIADNTQLYDINTISLLKPFQNLAANLISNIHELNKQQAMQSAIEKSEERFSLAVNGTNEGIFDIKYDSVSDSYFSPRIFTMLGYADGEFPPTLNSIERLAHPDDLGTATQNITECAADNSCTYVYETRLRTKTGGYSWIEIHGSVHINNDDQPYRIVGSHKDINERKKYELLVYEQAQRYRAILDNALDGIITIDAQGAICEANPATEKILGYTRTELVGNNIRMLIPRGQQRDQHDQYLDNHQSSVGDEVVGMRREINILRKNGDTVPIEIAVGEVLSTDSTSNASLFVAVINDITERKKAEAATQEAIESAIDAEKTKSAFLANMSHEIRTPMHGIMGMLEALSNSDLPHTQNKQVMTARNAANNLLQIINDILDIEKIEAGKMKLENVDFSIRRIFEDIVSLLADQAHKKELTFECCIAADVVEYINGDPLRLRQILFNLIGNALKFTAQGHVLVTVNKLDENETNTTLKIEVSDSGIGVPEQALPYLFDSFRQADRSMSRQFGGTGLGLCICKQIVALIGGKIGVKSELGKGSSFWFTVNFTKSIEKPTEPDNRLLNKSALFIGEDNILASSLREYLLYWGVDMDTVKPDNNTLRKIHDSRLDFLFINYDSQLQHNGDFAAQIRSAAETSGLKSIFLLSSHLENSMKSQFGNDLVLTRPLQQSSLFNALIASLGIETAKDAVGSNTVAAPVSLQGHILLAEDNPVNQEVARSMLESLNLTVDIAENGLIAVSRAADHEYDIIFMDCQMPKMDGYEATKTIRASEHDDEHKIIIALTANAMEGDRDQCVSAGMDDYMSKPFTLESLATKIHAWINTNKKTIKTEVVTTPEAAKPRLDIDSALDLQKIEELKSVLGGKLSHIIDVFSDNTRTQLDKLKQAIQTNDKKSIVAIAHAIKGSSANIGAQGLSSTAKTLEQALRNNEAINLVPVVAQLEKQLSETIHTYNKYLSIS